MQTKITVFGANGGIGGHVVRQALHAGHAVTAVVRDSARFDLTHPALEVMTVSGLTDPDVLRPALAASDAAISGVGPRGRKDGPVASTATHGILRALTATKRRTPVGRVPEGESFLNRRILLPFIGAFAREVYADLGRMEDEIEHSPTDWTIVRPPKLVDKPRTGRYRTVVGGNVPHGYSIGRADVAEVMLAVLDDESTLGEPVGIAY